MSPIVALRKESVDRNLWWGVRKAVGSVALRKESVDRNRLILSLLALLIWSLSARRAWIEIIVLRLTKFASLVALRKESVDRNKQPSELWRAALRRSPQGERG